ncbi:hypothetical protein TSUD_354410 [Trifolium subterraneum]|uniref:Uncharacterized protein n=1 Tax=Trifolium subterraneum TaxID=3900 RepID=A0A2Z6NN17_TRISU|nr:hypothetical protein TSUD_354410 [Trifolium subterraneum]
MVVKVGDQRFDIRVIEETGSWSEVGGGWSKTYPGWKEEQSSRASYDGDSNCAVMEGCFSESGSGADVSESCQVLLELQARGGDRSEIEGIIREPGYTEEEMSGNIPHLLGYNVEPLVNFERDMGVDTLLEAEETNSLLENETTNTMCGDLEEMGISQRYEVDIVEKVVPCGGKFHGFNGECVGPSTHAKGVGSGCLAQTSGVTKKSHPTKTLKKAAKKVGSTKSNGVNRKYKPPLPFHKLSLLPANQRIPHRRKRNSKTVSGIQGGTVAVGVVDSDSTQNSDFSSSVQGVGTTNMDGIDIEVVLPSFPTQVEVQDQMGGRVTSGLELILQEESGGGVPDRKKIEAEKLIELAEEVGLKFHGDAGEDLARMIYMEGRHCKEKEGWEMRRENTGFQ